MKYSDNNMWNSLEKLKNQLRDAGCQGLANQVYIMQLSLESKLVKEFLCKK